MHGNLACRLFLKKQLEWLLPAALLVVCSGLKSLKHMLSAQVGVAAAKLVGPFVPGSHMYATPCVVVVMVLVVTGVNGIEKFLASGC